MKENDFLEMLRSGDDAYNYTSEWFSKCVRMVDDEFGEGYSKSNPELIGRLVESCSRNLLASFNLLDK